MIRVAWLDAVQWLLGVVGAAVGYLGGRGRRNADTAQVQAGTTRILADATQAGVGTAEKSADLATKVVAMVGVQMADMERRLGVAERRSEVAERRAERAEEHTRRLVEVLEQLRQDNANHTEWDREVTGVVRAAGLTVSDPPPLGDFLIPTDLHLPHHPEREG